MTTTVPAPGTPTPTARRRRGALAGLAALAVTASLGLVAVPPAQADDGPLTAKDFAAAVQKAARKGLRSTRAAGGATAVVTPYQASKQTATVRQNLDTGWVKLQTVSTGGGDLPVTSYQKGRNVFSSPSQPQVDALKFFSLRVPRFVEDPTADRSYYPVTMLTAARDASTRKLTQGLSGFTQTTTGSGVQLTAVVTGSSAQAVYTVDSQGRLASVVLPAIGASPKSSTTYTYRKPAFKVPSTSSVVKQGDVDAVTYAYTLRKEVIEIADRNGRTPTTRLLIDHSRKVRSGQASVSRSSTTVTVTGPSRVFTMQVFSGHVMATYRVR